MKVPYIIILAGPNGAGKSTAQPFLVSPELEFVNADNIARELRENGASTGTQADIAAGRLLISRLETLTCERKSFCLETNLASKTLVLRITDWQTAGYQVIICYFRLPSPDLAVARVRLRVSAGGHDIPEDTIRRRFATGLSNFSTVYAPLANHWLLIDSALVSPQVIDSGDKSGQAEVLTALQDVPQVETALQKGVGAALRGHKAAGRAIPAWNGGVVWIAPEE